MKTKILLCILISNLFLSAKVEAAIPVFPGAQGFGTQTTAGRGGQIIKVNSLADPKETGKITLRDAINTVGTRTIVFEIGGEIKLKSQLTINKPKLTIAGQTAPGQGILIRDYGISVKTNDVLIQHLAIRPGDEGAGPYDALDGIQILDPSYNVVIDHCSVSWAIDENADTWTDVHDITFSNNIISEGLRFSLHSQVGGHSKGYLAGRRNKNIAFIGNLQAHNDTRNPMVYGSTTILVANNIFYNGGSGCFSWAGDGWEQDGPPKGTFIGNVYKAGPNTTAYCAISIGSSPSGAQIYESSNYYDKGVIRGGKKEYFVSSPPVPITGITIKTEKNEIFNNVLKNSGARPAFRDAVDNRIANPVSGEVVKGSGSFVDTVNSNMATKVKAPGGWPIYPTITKTFDIGSTPNNDDDSDGYTNIEELLSAKANQVEGKSTSPIVDPVEVVEVDEVVDVIETVDPVNPGIFEFANNAYSVGENEGQVNITIKRTGGSDGAVSVQWRTLADSATFNADYKSFSWLTLNFDDGEISKTLPINIVQDAISEESEKFNVLLRNPTAGATLGAKTIATVTIIDDDAFSAPTPARYALADFIKLRANWFKHGTGMEGDVNNDQKVNSKDLGVMMSNWE